MSIARLAHAEDLWQARTLQDADDGVFNEEIFSPIVLMARRELVEGGKHIKCVVFTAMKDEVARRFGKEVNENERREQEQDGHCDGYSPRRRAGLDPGKCVSHPYKVHQLEIIRTDVENHTECASDASGDAHTEGHHEHAATTMCLETFDVPCWD